MGDDGKMKYQAKRATKHTIDPFQFSSWLNFPLKTDNNHPFKALQLFARETQTLQANTN